MEQMDNKLHLLTSHPTAQKDPRISTSHPPNLNSLICDVQLMNSCKTESAHRGMWGLGPFLARGEIRPVCQLD